MKLGFLSFIIIFVSFNLDLMAFDKKPYHHMSDGTFRNPEGSPVRSENVKFSYSQFTKEKKS